MEDEIIIMCGIDELTKLFYKQHIIVWYDPHNKSKSKLKYLTELTTVSEVQVFQSWQEASNYIKKTQHLCQIISSGADGELFVKAISEESHVLFIYIFDENIDPLSEWVSANPKIASVETKFRSLQVKIHKNSLKIDFPAFAPVFNDTDTSHMNKLHFYLRGLIDFKNRDQAKRDLLTLASKIYIDKKNTEEFTDTYNEYNMNKILTWYAKESFLYKMVNNCLRIATSDSILYARLAIKDLESAIKDCFNSTVKPFNGLVYRGAYITDQEWDSLKTSQGKEIEMYGFFVYK